LPTEPENMKGMVDRHNYWRTKVNIKNVTWSDDLAKVAQEWAENLASRGCILEHRSGKWDSPYGENIYWSSGMTNTPDKVVDSWAEEIQYFNKDTGKCEGGVCGHYTQIVWANTSQIGCGMARCGNQEVWVCNYNPPGNYVGQKPY